MSLSSRQSKDVKYIAPRLRPRIHPHIHAFLQNKDMLFDLVEEYGSPLNLVFPQNIHDNIAEFQSAYKKNHMRGRIYFTSKPCKSLALYREASGQDIGIDVSSAGSLDAAISCGWGADRIGATGPKNKTYLSSVLKNGVLLNVDNIDELKQAAILHSALGIDRKIRITLRLADTGNAYTRSLSQDDTTFGIRTIDVDFVLSFLQENKDIFDFQGFSYHASMAGDEQRIAAMEHLMSLTYLAIKKGFKPSIINIGGGFSITYADDPHEWADYTHAVRESVSGRIPSQTWNNNGLGYRLENGAIRGGAMYINHAPAYTKGDELDRWLSFRLPSFGNATFADIVRDSLLKLSIEPGRGMLDQCGVTLGRVAYTKYSACGERLAGLEMNRSNIHSNHFKQLTEPLVIPRGQGVENLSSEGVYYTGNLCLSFDMLQYNKTYPAFLPQAGDLVVFMNTAAYMMDFTESETLMQPVARKIALTNEQNAWRACPDEEYRRYA
jgi:diaminopimelate decarboxylase